MANQIILPGVGVVVIPPTNVNEGLPISACTAPGNLCCVYWGDRLTIRDSPTCQMRIKNNTQAPVTLKMTAKINNLNANPPPGGQIPQRAWVISWDKENTTLTPGQYVNAILRLHIPYGQMVQDWPFVSQVTITGT